MTYTGVLCKDTPLP